MNSITEKKKPQNKLVFLTETIFSEKDNLENANVFLLFSKIPYPKIKRITNLPSVEGNNKYFIGLSIKIKIRTTDIIVQMQIFLQELTYSFIEIVDIKIVEYNIF